MAKKMSFCLRYGDSCGIPFFKDKFCDEHREWAFLRPYLHDRPQQPWTDFSIYNSKKNILKMMKKSKKNNQKNTVKIITLKKR
jgi:hypothetical protein